MKTRRASRRYRRTSVRAVMLLWFCMVSLPVSFFVGIISVEYQRVLTGSRAAQSLAETSANGALALQQIPYTGGGGALVPFDVDNVGNRDATYVDPTVANMVVRRTVTRYFDAIRDNVGPSLFVQNGDVRVFVYNKIDDPNTGVPNGKPVRVRVEVPYRVVPVGFVSITEFLIGEPTSAAFSGVAVGEAYICEPDASYTPTYGNVCVKPGSVD